MMKFVGVVLCLLAMQPWEAAAHPRRMKGSSQKDEVEIDEGFGTEEIPPVEDDRIEVIIGLNVQDEESTFTAMSNTIDLLSDSVTLEELIPEISSGVARIPIEMMETLRNHPRVRYVELNGDIYENSETVPAGIQESFGGTDPLSYRPGPGLGTQCSDPDVFKVAIVDGGLDVAHYDFEYCGIYDGNGQADPNREQHCMGKAFLTGSDTDAGQNWYNSERSHGLHVAGTVAASGLNQAGVTGMIADEKFCLVIARVFGDGGNAQVSKVADAIIWAANQGAKVINMSLGTSSAYTAVTDAIQYAHQKGTLLVASAGNGADDNPPKLVNYPADYDEVLSIAAVDSSYRVAAFSNYNEHVDMAAVGVDVVSAYALPGGGTQTDIVYNAGTFSGIQMIYSKYVSGDGVTGTLVNCELGSGTCPGNGGHVCLIERGGSSYHQKVANCEQSNGVAAIIYNNNDGAVKGNFGTVGNSPRFTSIPAVGIPRDMGLQLLALAQEGTEVTISSPLASNGYGTMSGTSMAAPHVTGAAGLIWRSCPDCSREDVVDCLLSTTEDKGKRGRDDYYGTGVLDTPSAFACLSARSCCVSPQVEEITEQPSAAPTQSPIAPSGAPTMKPSPQPTGLPTASPIALSSVPTMKPSPQLTGLPTASPIAPSSVPTMKPTAQPSAAPTQTPQVSGGAFSSCGGLCTERDDFCIYKLEELCLAEQAACQTSCQSAVGDGALDTGLLEFCQATWCGQEHSDCIVMAEVPCDADYTACQLACGDSV